jgi:hypothetical protein
VEYKLPLRNPRRIVFLPLLAVLFDFFGILGWFQLDGSPAVVVYTPDICDANFAV